MFILESTAKLDAKIEFNHESWCSIEISHIFSCYLHGTLANLIDQNSFNDMLACTNRIRVTVDRSVPQKLWHYVKRVSVGKKNMFFFKVVQNGLFSIVFQEFTKNSKKMFHTMSSESMWWKLTNLSLKGSLGAPGICRSGPV